MPQIDLTSTANATLKTAGKYCEEDILIVQNLEEMSASPKDVVQEFVPSEGKNGIAKFTVGKMKLQTKTVTPTKSTQNIDADDEYDALKSTTIEPIPDEYIIPSGTLVITENNTYVVTDKSNVEVNVPSTGANGLQWKCDNMKSLYYEFYNYTGESLDEPLSGIDTSQVTNFGYCFSNNTNLTSVPELDTSKGENLSYMFQNCKGSTDWEIDLSSATDVKYMCNGASNTKKFKNTSNVADWQWAFYNSKVPSIEGLDLSGATSLLRFLSSNTVITEFIHPETSNVSNFKYAFEGCTNLTTLSLDLYSVTSTTNFSNIISKCYALNNVIFKNIRLSTAVYGSYSTNAWCKDLPLDNLIGFIKELWDYSSGTTTYTLTIGPTNLAKLTDVYVKLIDVTDEMIAEDPHVASKKPCVVCESTDEGAMTITEYATSKMWTLA